MIWRIEIKRKKGVFDAAGEGVLRSLRDLHVNAVTRVEVAEVYTLGGELSGEDATRVARELLVDPVTQDYVVSDGSKAVPPAPGVTGECREVVEIAYNPGVMDPVEESTLKGIVDLGITTVVTVRTSKKYSFFGTLSARERDTIVTKALSNKLIQHVVTTPLPGAPVAGAAVDGRRARGVVKAASASAGASQATGKTSGARDGKEQPAFHEPATVAIVGATDTALVTLSREGQLFLNLDEMKAIAAYFTKIGRNPTDCELETIAQTWSEHCFHKTFRGTIRYRETVKGKPKTRTITSLLKSTIVKATTEINKPWCVSVFHDNAGVIKFDKDFHVCFKVETHNHPSALEPFGGANTGIGGVIRDVLGTGLGAKPICNTDVFCFASPETPLDSLPAGTLHPKRVMKGVVSGVRDYGNKMGIPTVNGAVLFDPHFVGNPLVYCGTVGLLPVDAVKKKVKKGDLVVVLGGRTGRDGIHGATFSSGDLTHESEVVSSGAVQIGNPIQEKKVLDVLLQARDKKLYTAITDCGAGGLSSAAGEMGQTLGVRIDLSAVPLKYHGLRYDEIWISESQERMVLSVSPDKKDELLALCAAENVEATVIGTFSGSGRIELFYHGVQVCDLDTGFLYDGNPMITKQAVWTAPKLTAPVLPKKVDCTAILAQMLSHYNVCSKEWIIRQYDHEVQGGSVIKPLVGVAFDGPSDASVIAPRMGSKKGIAVSNGINVEYGKIDPYWMAVANIDEAVRQIIAVGGDIEKIAILDNFCWGNPDKPDRLGGLVRAAEGCYAASVGYQVPFISGKDSLYNEYTHGARSIAIPGSILISAIGIINDVTKTVTMDFKEPGNLIYVVGTTYDELGGSIYFNLKGCLGTMVPMARIPQAVRTFKALTAAVKKGYIRAMHDCSEGGIGVALAEMAFSGGCGLTARLDGVPYKGTLTRDDVLLFSESNSRFIVEVNPQYQKKFEALLAGVPHGVIGWVEGSSEIIIYGRDRQVCVSAYSEQLKEAWQRPLRW